LGIFFPASRRAEEWSGQGVVDPDRRCQGLLNQFIDRAVVTADGTLLRFDPVRVTVLRIGANLPAIVAKAERKAQM